MWPRERGWLLAISMEAIPPNLRLQVREYLEGGEGIGL